MSASDDLSKLPASESAKRQSLGKWKQLMARYPLTSRWGLAFQIATTLSVNGVVVWLVTSGRMTPFELVVLVALEAALLIGIASVQSRLVPEEAREKNPMGLRERLGTLAFALFWLGGVYSFVFFGFVPSIEEMGRALRDPLAFLASSTLKWPLLITLVGAAVDALQDAAHFRRHGGTFLSTPGFNGAARWLTLFLGGIPFVVPFFGTVIAIKLIVERIAAAVKRRVGMPSERIMIVLLLLILPAGWLVFAGIGWVGNALESAVGGVGLWALGYCAAKFVAELFIVCIPLIASKAHAEDAEALAKPAKQPSKRKSRQK